MSYFLLCRYSPRSPFSFLVFLTAHGILEYTGLPLSPIADITISRSCVVTDLIMTTGTRFRRTPEFTGVVPRRLGKVSNFAKGRITACHGKGLFFIPPRLEDAFGRPWRDSRVHGQIFAVLAARMRKETSTGHGFGVGACRLRQRPVPLQEAWCVLVLAMKFLASRVVRRQPSVRVVVVVVGIVVVATRR